MRKKCPSCKCNFYRLGNQEDPRCNSCINGKASSDREPNYMTKILADLEKNPPKPGLQDIWVYHDDHCGIFKKLPCDCDPDIKIVPFEPTEG